MRRALAPALRTAAPARQERPKKVISYQGDKVLYDAHKERKFRPKAKTKALMFINYKPVEIEPNEESLIEVCLREGIMVPKFCYHPLLSVAGNCRMCMVQLAGTQNIIVACATPVMAGMSVLTDTRLVKGAREGNVELLLINHPLDCPICDQQYECDLQDVTAYYGSNRGRYREDKHCMMDKVIDPLIRTSFNKCIHCTRCTRWVQEETKEWTWGMTGRGSASEITTFIPNKYSKANVLKSRNFFAAQLCPVGALNPQGDIAEGLSKAARSAGAKEA
eukprot:TRINITY_DN24452_c0_g1_i1.p1 TRINITY_DN24452_c0_g1~~TRINITY_DN24452_c0_g1_i1.p1  ORF type:complete len:313 (+),score=94.71 TRINITY_DN24452_c0_g1_i1:110-940(+)